MTTQDEKKITKIGNPAKPQGDEGAQMLQRMNQSHSSVTQWALSHFDYNEKDRALDIGCGGGNTIRLLSEHVCHVSGIDYSSVSVQESLNYNSDLVKQGKVSVRQGNVEDLPFNDDVFDKITTVESFYFWPNPQENLKEVYRVLKVGGTFLMVCDTYKKDDLSQDVLDNIEQYHLFVTDPEGYVQLFKNAGFTDVVAHLKEGTDWICVEGKKAV